MVGGSKAYPEPTLAPVSASVTVDPKEAVVAMHAYLDPGSGSMLLGLVASGMAGIVVIFKTFGQRIKSVVFFWKKDDPVVAEPTVTEETVDQTTPSAS
jgi:hypothetical protein